jgi:FKBP-type peptidyl-prolyl cis-trans isomerase FklB
MKKLCGVLCALALAAFVPMCAAEDATPATEKAAPAATTPAAAPAEEAPAPATTAPAPATPESPAPTALKSDKEKMSYAIGVNWGTQLKNINLDLDMESLFQGMRDVVSGHKLALSPQEIQATLQKTQADVRQKQQERMKEMTARMREMGEKNKVEGPKFLEENKKKEGVVTLPSGLQYKVLKEGAGKLPGPTDTVTAAYRGMFIDGTPFDSSDRNGDLVVALDSPNIIPGMKEALKMMKVGSKWMVFIPPELAYKEQGAPPVVGPNAVLIFEVELLGIKENPKNAPVK